MKKQFYLVVFFVSLLQWSFAKNNFDFSTVVSVGTNKNVLSGYFNPDNYRDIVEYLPATGKIRVGISNGKPDFLSYFFFRNRVAILFLHSKFRFHIGYIIRSWKGENNLMPILFIFKTCLL